MVKQSTWAVSKALEEGGVRAEIREDGHIIMIFSANGAMFELSPSDEAAIDIAFAMLDGKLSEMPSESELKMAFRVLRGKAAWKTGRIPCDGIENNSPIVNAILAFMERRTEWRGKTEVLLKAVSSQDASPNWKHISTRVFAYRINQSKKTFRFFDLFIETFRGNDGSKVRMHWLDQCDASDASDASDARGYSDEEREAMEAMAGLSVNDKGMEKH